MNFSLSRSKETMRKVATLTLLLMCSLAAAFGQQSDYDKLKGEAEKLYAEKSYARAYELYAQTGAMSLPPGEARWVNFRLADTAWRAQAATNTADSTKYDQAQARLEELVRDVKRDEDRDLVWAEAQESLGDFWWVRPNTYNWNEAWLHYQKALDWWAGARDLDTARERYLRIVWNAAAPPSAQAGYYGGYYGNALPLEILENALRIAQDPNDQARGHFNIAMRLRTGGEWEQRQRTPEEFEAALRPGKSTEWYADALYYYAEWMASTGRITQLDNGQWQQQPDYVKALELFRRLTTEYQKGETRYYDAAQQQIASIIDPVVGISVSNIFLPGSEIQLHLSWRNVKRVDLALYRVDLTRDLRFTDQKQSSWGWVQQINPAGRERVKSWSKETNDDGLHKPQQEALRLDQRLPAGAYLVEARSGGASAREVVLVTDASLVLKSSGKQALVYFCHAVSGAPLTGANVKLWEKSYSSGSQQWVWRESAKETNRDGIAVFPLTGDQSSGELFVSAASSDRQAFSLGNSYHSARDEQPWRIYAFTDRPAYRPKETVQWKFVARKYENSVYSTPANQVIEFEVLDPRGAKVKEGKVTLNTFGSAWGALELTEAMSLGSYQVAFYDEGHHHAIGGATLFRLEEYKLPEFKVSVRTPEADGRKKAFRLGEEVEVAVRADYYFGGAVSGAGVEVVVYQNPFYHYWQPPREYSWYYSDLAPRYYQYGGRQGQIIKRETLRTDAMGQATLKFQTPRGSYQEFEYYIEARVTDASRREIIGSDTVRVTRQRYYVYPRPDHNLYRPGDQVSINVKSLDANDQPLPVAGQIKVTRDYFYEIWIDPAGREVKGEELKRIQREVSARGGLFPPPPDKGGKGWLLKFRGYQHDDVLTRDLKTDAAGEAALRFTPEREGYYHVAWTSPDRGGPLVQSETAVWVTTSKTSELGYRHGGVEIIADQDTFRLGQRAPVMLSTMTSDRYVLFSIEGEDLYDYQLVHLAGTAKLIEVPLAERHVPNIFLSAAMVSDRQIFTDTKQVVVPPVEHFLDVEVKPDRPQYRPREEGTLTITTRDRDGGPVAAEVAIGLIDESVYYIQQDAAGDPRQFYFGTKRALQTQTQSTFQQKSYTKLVEGADRQLIDENLLAQQRAPLSFNRGASDDVNGFLRPESRAMSKRAAGIVAGIGDLDRRDAYAVDKEAPADEASAVNGRRIVGLSELKPGAAGAVPSQEPAVQVRSDFRSTVIWRPDVVTDSSGVATVKVKYPDSLTGWKATARVTTNGDKFGVASADTRTRQPLVVRLQAPRFFVVGDSVIVSAVINNNTDRSLTVTPSLDARGVVVGGLVRDGQTVRGEQGPVRVPPNGEARVDWATKVQEPGTVRLKVTARAEAQSDAMEREFTAYEHGIEKLVAKSGKLPARGGDSVTVRLDIPRERRPESTALTVQVAPSMAVTMLDALPYLIDYPYGCAEQTMSRFLPAAITAKTLKDLGLSPEAAMTRVFGGIEPGSAAATHPAGKRGLTELDRIIRQSLDRLYDMQHADGGWGWWKEDATDHFMTAYVLWGLTLARDAGIEIKPEVLGHATAYLDQEIVEEEGNYDMQAWLLHAMAAYHASSKESDVSPFQAKAFDNLWVNREKLNAYTRSLLALCAHYYGSTERAQTLIRNLENGVRIDHAPDTSIVQRGAQSTQSSVIATAHWGEDGIFYRWSDGGVEATSFALRALLAVDPQNKLVEPVTNWLVKNRRGAQWSNTRDTAITVLALNDYLRASGEALPELEYEVIVNDHPIARRRVTAADALSAPSRFVVDRQYIRDGANDIRIQRRAGNGPLYFAAQARFFSLEEPVKAAGNEIFVRREYYKLVGRRTLLKGYTYDRLPLRDGEVVNSGDRVEVVVTIEAKNNYEYLLFEDLKPAGLESVRVRSGEPLYAQEMKSGAVERKFSNHRDMVNRPAELVRTGDAGGTEESNYTGRASYVYEELRDRKIAMFISHLSQGVWEIRYDLRAEAPGAFHALPMLGQAMYVPEIRCNDDEVRIGVADQR